MLNMDCPGVPTQGGCLRTSWELQRSVSRPVSQPGQSKLHQVVLAGLRQPNLNRTTRTYVGPVDIVQYSWARSIMTWDQCQTWAGGRTSSLRTPPQREAEARRCADSHHCCVTHMTCLDGGHE